MSTNKQEDNHSNKINFNNSNQDILLEIASKIDDIKTIQAFANTSRTTNQLFKEIIKDIENILTNPKASINDPKVRIAINFIKMTFKTTSNGFESVIKETLTNIPWIKCPFKKELLHELYVIEKENLDKLLLSFGDNSFCKIVEFKNDIDLNYLFQNLIEYEFDKIYNLLKNNPTILESIEGYLKQKYNPQTLRFNAADPDTFFALYILINDAVKEYNNGNQNAKNRIIALFKAIPFSQALIDILDIKPDSKIYEELTNILNLHTKLAQAIVCNSSDVELIISSFILNDGSLGSVYSYQEEFISPFNLMIKYLSKSQLQKIFEMHPEIIELINTTLSSDLQTPLMKLSRHEHQDTPEKFKFLVNEYKADLYLQDIDKNNVLHYAVGLYESSQINLELLKILLDQKMFLDHTNIRGKTALHNISSSYLNNSKPDKEILKKIIQLLVKSGARYDIPDSDGKRVLDLFSLVGYDFWTYLHLLSNRNNFTLYGTPDLDFQDKNGQTLLHRAVMQGNEQLCKFIIRNQARLFLQDKHGKTPLHHAIELVIKHSNNTDTNNLFIRIVDIIIDHASGSEFRIKSHQRCFDGYEQDLKIVYKINQDNKGGIDLKDNEGFTALHYAFKINNFQLVYQLILPVFEYEIDDSSRLISKFISSGADFTILDKRKQNILHYVANFDFTEQFKKYKFPIIDLLNALINTKKIDINAQDDQGKTPLQYAIEKDNVIIALLIIRFCLNSIDVRLHDNKFINPIILALEKENPELIHACCYIATSDYRGNALHILVSHGKNFIINQLLNSNPEEIFNRIEKLHILSCGGAPWKIPQPIKFSSENIIDYRDKENLNAKNQNGQTPLHLAIELGSFGIAETLIKAGADVNIKNNKNESPLMLMKRSSNVQFRNLYQKLTSHRDTIDQEKGLVITKEKSGLGN